MYEDSMSKLQKSLVLMAVGLGGMASASYFSTGSPWTVLKVMLGI